MKVIDNPCPQPEALKNRPPIQESMKIPKAVEIEEGDEPSVNDVISFARQHGAVRHDREKNKDIYYIMIQGGGVLDLNEKQLRKRLEKRVLEPA